MQVPALIQKHLYTKQLPRIAILKAVCRFVVLLYSTFCIFFILLPRVFSLPLATLSPDVGKPFGKKSKSLTSSSELQTFLVFSQHPAWVISPVN